MEVFNEGISLVLSRWSALRTAVENEWGGRNSNIKAQQFAADIFHWFTQPKDQLDIYDLETLLYDGTIPFNLEIDDGSVEEIAEELMVMHEECLEGNFGSVERLREASHNPAAPPGGQQQQLFVNGDGDEIGNGFDENIEDGNSGNMVVDIQQSESNLNSMNTTVNEPQPEVADEADDGWTTVSKRRSKGRRN